MADAKKCDRCGEYYTDTHKTDDLTIICYRNIAFCKPYDLCEKCRAKLKQFMDMNGEWVDYGSKRSPLNYKCMDASKIGWGSGDR